MKTDRKFNAPYLSRQITINDAKNSKVVILKIILEVFFKLYMSALDENEVTFHQNLIVDKDR